MKIYVLNILLNHLLSLTKIHNKSKFVWNAQPTFSYQDCFKNRQLLDFLIDDISNKFVKPDEISSSTNPCTAMDKQRRQAVLQYWNSIGKVKKNLYKHDMCI